MNILSKTVLQLKGLLDAGDVGSREVTEASFARIAAVEPKVGAFLSLRQEEALAEAAEIDEERARGEAEDPPTGWGDQAYRGQVPSHRGDNALMGNQRNLQWLWLTH